jgi:asparagine synthase (glutamine-hydrolysing)
MPGIAGLITRMPPEEAERQLQQMVAALRHERFYVTGSWVEESSGVYVGWAARKDSFSDRMPLRNERGDVVLVFSGEDFPEPSTVHRLRKQGHHLDSAKSSYLVHLSEEEPSFPASLNGRFHGLLADRRHGEAIVFNDRFGMHRLYYKDSKEAFYFAAEAKAILAVRPEVRRMDFKGAGEFAACGCTLEGRSFFQGVGVLNGGSRWVFRNGLLRDKGTYFKASEWEEQPPLESESYYQRLREIFSRNLSRYFNGDQPIAMSLTGGLDTRIIMAWRNLSPGSLPCYTFGGVLRDCQDVITARSVARMCNQSHQVLRVGEEFLKQFASYAERTVYLTDGCADVGRSPDLYINEQAREIAPVRMTGTYGGEILRRVQAFKATETLPGLFQPEFLSSIHEAGETYAQARRGHPLSFAVFKQSPWYQYGVLALDETQLSVRAPYLDNDLIQTVFRAPESAVTNNTVCLRLIADGNKALLKIPTDRGLAGDRNRLSRAVAQFLLEFLFKAEYAYDVGMPQPVARVDHFLSLLRLERLFLGRHKYLHFRIWYRDALAAHVKDLLLDSRSLSRPYIQRKRVEAVVRGHLKGDRNYTNEIHQLMTLELVHRLFIDN